MAMKWYYYYWPCDGPVEARPLNDTVASPDAIIYKSILASAIQSFLNNQSTWLYADQNCYNPRKMGWPCGEIPFRMLPWTD